MNEHISELFKHGSQVMINWQPNKFFMGIILMDLTEEIAESFYFMILEQGENQHSHSIPEVIPWKSSSESYSLLSVCTFLYSVAFETRTIPTFLKPFHLLTSKSFKTVTLSNSLSISLPLFSKGRYSPRFFSFLESLIYLFCFFSEV